MSASTEAVDKATAALAASSESIRLKNMTLRKNEQRMASIDRELGEAPATQRTLAEVRAARWRECVHIDPILLCMLTMACAPHACRARPQNQEQLTEETAKLEKKRADVAASKYEANLAEMNRGIAELKSALTALRRERDDLSSMAGIAGKVQLLQRDADEKRDAAGQLYTKCMPRMQAVFGAEVCAVAPCACSDMRASRCTRAPSRAGADRGCAEGTAAGGHARAGAGCRRERRGLAQEAQRHGGAGRAHRGRHRHTGAAEG